MTDRKLSPLDTLIAGVDQVLRSAGSVQTHASRTNPAADIDETDLSTQEKSHAAALMRVNHAGEVAAQGLYQGHAAVARDESIERQMRDAASEELDHLGWCEDRLTELDAHPSQLRPAWYAGAYVIGATSGLFGDKWSLGFIEETERQVAAHLTDHLRLLPENDLRSRAIVEQMRDEEEMHGNNARVAGAAPLPRPVQEIMRLCAKVMTRTAYWI